MIIQDELIGHQEFIWQNRQFGAAPNAHPPSPKGYGETRVRV